LKYIMKGATPLVDLSRQHPSCIVLWSLIFVLTARFLIYFFMSVKGYFYGVPWDTFVRTSLAWQWAQKPYFSAADGYWPPLQFWLVGVVYALLRPFTDTSTILVPVIVNNLFLVGSVLITVWMAYRIGGAASILGSAIFVTIFPADIFVSYSALADPMYTFFILLASYIVARNFLDNRLEQSTWMIGTGFAALLAAATHLIGWFLAFGMLGLIGYHTLGAMRRRQFKSFMLGIIGMLLCALFPLLWLMNNWLLWNDPLHFMRIASNLQAPYAGNLSLLGRIGILFKVFFTVFFPLSWLSVVAIAYVARKDIQKTIYLLPAVSVLGFLWLVTFLAFDAPYQEPRYLVFFGWVAIPFIATWLSDLWTKHARWRTGVVLGLGLVIVYNLFVTFHFTNSFGPEVRLVASRAKQWLDSQPADTSIVIQGASYAETMVIPVVAGNPYRFIPIEDQRWRDPNQARAIFSEAWAKKQLVIVRDAELSFYADSTKVERERVGSYFLIFPKSAP